MIAALIAAFSHTGNSDAKKNVTFTLIILSQLILASTLFLIVIIPNPSTHLVVQGIAADANVSIHCVALALTVYLSEIYLHFFFFGTSVILGCQCVVLKTRSPTLEVVLGTVLAMYTKNTMHDWIPAVTSVGSPSYVYVLTYRQFTGPLFMSMACEKLPCPTVLQIPRTHVLFSLASFTNNTRQDTPNSDGICRARAKFWWAIQDLGRLMKEKPALDDTAIGVELSVAVDLVVDAMEVDGEEKENGEYGI
ncbi:hypothetical protein K438DRAFT_1977929 [Mycena galopus ATCC 62051]|nr:hypothetical protein K438DRAFT_1977929 [Mycena galopus ATCC 62051]